MKKLFLLSSILFLSITTKAGNYYWVNGTGKWSDYAAHWAISSGGSVFHVQIPSPIDNVYFDANSFLTAGDTLYIDTTLVNCNTLDLSGATNSPVLYHQNGTVNIYIYGSFIIHSNVSWKLQAIINFKSALSGNIINTFSAQLWSQSYYYTSFYFNGTGEWFLQNDLDLDSNYIGTYGTGSGVVINSGIFHSNNYLINCYEFNINSHSFLGSSVINCNSWYAGLYSTHFDSTKINCFEFFHGGNNNFYQDVYASYIDYSTGCIFHNVSTGAISCDGCSFNHVLLFGPHGYLLKGTSNSFTNTFNLVTISSQEVSISGYSIFDSLIFSIPGIKINLSGKQTINSFIEANGSCSGITAIIGTNDSIVKSSGTMVFNDVWLENITASGGAIFTANNSSGINVNGITINSSPQNKYWVGGNGNWSDVSHWSNTSGGAGGSCAPSPIDSVFFDNYSNFYIMNFDVPYAYCKSLNCSGVPVFSNAKFSGNTEINDYGSFIIDGNISWDISSTIHLKSQSTGNIISTSNAVLADTNTFLNFEFDGIGNWSLQNDFDLVSFPFPSLSSGSLIIRNGTFKSNNHYINCGELLIDTFAVGNFGSSYIRCNTWNASCSNLHADSTTIYSEDFIAGNSNFYNDVSSGILNDGSGCSFHNVSINRSLNNSSPTSIQNSYNKLTVNLSPVTVNVHDIFDSLIFETPGATVNISGSQTINSYLETDGSCSGLINLVGTDDTIVKNSGSVVLNYVALQNIRAMGGATFTANNSADNGGNSGMIINSTISRNLYWVGGTGNWSDSSHWSLTSGGFGGSCLPSQFDNVFFDTNSNSSPGVIVYFDMSNNICHTLDCSGLTIMIEFQGNTEVDIYGSFILSNFVYWNLLSDIHFKSPSTVNIIEAYSIKANFIFDGSGTWTLQTDLILLYFGGTNGAGLQINNGIVISNNHTLTCGHFGISITASAFFGTSVINCSSWESSCPNLNVDSTIINCSGNFYAGFRNHYNIIYADNITYGDSCTFHFASVQTLLNAKACVFENAIFSGSSSSIYNASYPINLFHKLSITSSQMQFQNADIYDTLIFANPGMIISIQDTIKVNNVLLINSDPGFPCSISGPGTISFGNILCSDFIYLQNIKTTGGGQFFAGIHSVDLGGNTGWQFSSCSPVFSNVWPGDANYDLVVDNFDLLYIGVAYGDTGFVRVGASNAFTPQPCQDWFYQFINGTNVKKADSDGNGIVDAADTTAVSLNYGLTHPFRIPFHDETNAVGTELSFQVPPGTVTPGTVVNIPIMLGTSVNPANNVYGIAFTINYDIGLVQPGSLNIDFTGSWIESTNNHLSLVKDFPSAGKCDVAFTRINKTDISGTGQIGTLTFTVPANAYGYLNLSFSKIKLISHNEIDIPVSVHADSINTFVSEISDSHLSIYPNPSSGKLHVQFINKEHNKCLVTIFDPKGQVVYSEFTSNDTYDINTKDFVSGIYFMVIRNTESGRSFEGKILIE